MFTKSKRTPTYEPEVVLTAWRTAQASTLGGTPFRTLLALLGRAHPYRDGLICRSSFRCMARDVRSSPNTIVKGIRLLAEAGLVTIVRHGDGRRANVYTIDVAKVLRLKPRVPVGPFDDVPF